MVAVGKLRIRFGADGWVRTFQINDSKKVEEDSKKRGPQYLEEEVRTTKKKLKRDLSSQCLRYLREHQFGWIFSEPVDPVRLKIPDYLSVVSKPMDLGTIQSKLLRNSYPSDDEFAADVRLTFNNAMLYNPPENSIHKVAKELKQIFEVRWKELLLDGGESKIEVAGSNKPVLSEDVPLLLKPAVKGQNKKVIKKLGQGLKSCNSRSSGDVSSVTDCQAMNTSPGAQENESDGSVNSKIACVAQTGAIFGNDLKRTSLDHMPPEKALRAAILKGQFAETIVRAKHRKAALDQQGKKPDLIGIRIEKEQLEKRQRQEKARLEAEIKAARIAKRRTELKELRERGRLEIEKVVQTCDMDENNFRTLEMDLVRLCGTAYLTRSVLPELGLFLRNDDYMEEIAFERSDADAMRVDDHEEGEIF